MLTWRYNIWTDIWINHRSKQGHKKKDREEFSKQMVELSKQKQWFCNGGVGIVELGKEKDRHGEPPRVKERDLLETEAEQQEGQKVL